LDPIEPESDYNYIEKPMSGPATGLVNKSTPTGRFVYWPDQKPTNLMTLDSNSHCVACLESLPFHEGTQLTPTSEDYTPTKEVTTDPGLYTPDREVFVVEADTSTNN
jgi:hypothetical protein